MGPYTSYLLETVLMLAVVCGLALVVMVAAKRVGVGRASGPITLVGQLPLDARRGLYLVRVGARVFLVGVGEGGFTKLGEIPASEVPLEPAAAAGDSFAELFARALSRKREPSPSPSSEAPVVSAPAAGAKALKTDATHDRVESSLAVASAEEDS
ncbi:MAG: flagellar biosynthetic protein FliO [Myxococcales bacterium]|nr:flagellar biosynthetic protein FliO [Myxococcales bacterium]MBL0196304.1 flagellar biosynthetic protein FliO [Myxococcales bacterium]HQY62646.1 flagellar biosynthetic protein FliO [Polyangiaceae bacterium]